MPRARRAVREGSNAPEYRLTIKDMPAAERPRERLLELGPAALSNAELLAIILRTGMPGRRVTEMASQLLAEFRGLDGIWQASTTELDGRIPGLGPAKVAQVKAALELGRRLQIEATPDRRFFIGSPEDAAELLQLEMQHLEQETLVVLLLDAKHKVKAKTVCTGSVSSAAARMAEIFRQAVRENVSSLVLAHNHPSGDPTPSQDDLRITEQAIEAGRHLDIQVLDHVIIGRGCFKSLRREGFGLHWPGDGGGS